jgi:hypothetical protein
VSVIRGSTVLAAAAAVVVVVVVAVQLQISHNQEYTNPVGLIAWATKFCTVAPHVFSIGVIIAFFPSTEKCVSVHKHRA